MSRNDDSPASLFGFCRISILPDAPSCSYRFEQLIRNSEMGKLLLRIPEPIGNERRVNFFFLGEGENRFFVKSLAGKEGLPSVGRKQQLARFASDCIFWDTITATCQGYDIRTEDPECFRVLPGGERDRRPPSAKKVPQGEAPSWREAPRTLPAVRQKSLKLGKILGERR